MRKIKGTRKGLQVLKLDNTLIHKLYDTDIVKIEYQTWGYTNVILNSGSWKTNHTKNCMNDVLDQFNLKVVQKNFNWFLVDSENTIAWDFENGMNLGISLDNTIVKWGKNTHMVREA